MRARVYMYVCFQLILVNAIIFLLLFWSVATEELEEKMKKKEFTHAHTLTINMKCDDQVFTNAQIISK